MAIEFKLPDLGEGIHEGEIIEVLVSVGDKVIDGQPILVVETDKASVEVPSPVNGVVKEIRVKPGETVKVGQVLMTFIQEGEAERPAPPAAGAAKPAEAAEIGAAAAGVGVSRGPREGAGAGSTAKAADFDAGKLREKPSAEVSSAAAGRPAAPVSAGEGPVPAAPSTRRLARELGVDLHKVPPSGPGGRVTAEDVRAFAESGGKPVEKPAAKPGEGPVAERAETPVATPSEEAAEALVPGPFKAPPLPDFSQWGPVERSPLRSVRRATARHMALAWSQIPHVTHQDEADITELDAFRRKHKAEAEAGGGALSVTVFALKAAVIALKANPRFNASLDMDAEEIIFKHYYHLGVAVDTDRGLIVPVVRDVDRKSLLELAVELKDLAFRTREGKAARDEMIGGTFTITNIGVLGGTGFAPIVNYPQTAILGIGRATWRPTVRGDGEHFEIVPRLMLPLILGFDHRAADGADAARFVNTVRDALSDPEELLMRA